VSLGKNILDTFWTSGTSDKCPNHFGWCGGTEKEFIDFEGLGLKDFDSSGGNECISITLEKKGSRGRMLMQSEGCSNKRRAICEVIKSRFAQ
jgi:hypothetical protein